MGRRQLTQALPSLLGGEAAEGGLASMAVGESTALPA